MFFSDDTELGGWLGNHYIVTATDAPPPVQYAAHQLQEYLRKVRGKCLRIIATDRDHEPHHMLPLQPCIYVGPSPVLARRHPEVARINLAPEEILVWKEGPALVLTGGGDRAVLFAVYMFLEKYLGVRFITADVEHIPDSIPRLPERIAWRDKPAFEYRDMVALWRSSGDWAAKNRVNGHFSNAAAIQGGRAAFLPVTHSWEHLMPPKKYFDRHPEYYSEISGERVPRQLCLSNSRVRSICRRELRRWVKDHRDFSIFEVSENDGGGWCECAACRKLNDGAPTQSRIVMDFVNDLAAETAQRHPDKRVSTLSYATNRYPASGMKVHPNVIIRLCVDRELKQRLAAWRKVTKNIYIWSYFIQRYYPYLDGLQGLSRYCRAHGVTGFFVETDPFPNFGGLEPLPLRLYIAARLLWNPAIDIQPHIEDFMRYYYGPAAPELLDCIGRAYTLKKQMRLDKLDWYAGWDGAYPMHDYMQKMARLCRPVMTSARRKVRDSIYEQRVAEAELPFLVNEVFGRPLPPRFGRDQAYPRDIHGREKPAARLTQVCRKSGIVLPEQRALQSTPALRIKHGRLEVIILPEIGGRIAQIFYGKPAQTLCPVSCDLNDFCCVGWEEYIGRFFHDPGWNAPFRVIESRQERIVMACRLDSGMDVRRSFRLVSESNVAVKTVLTNRAPIAREGCVRTHPRLAFNPEVDEVEYTSVSGQKRRCLIADFAAMQNRGHVFASDAGASARYLEGENIPDGRIVFHLNGRGLEAAFEFNRHDTEKILLIGGKSGGLTLDIVARAQKLAPGARMVFECNLQLVTQEKVLPG